jgi:hypothetical protein
MGTGNWSLVIKPPGQALMQLPQAIHKLSSTLMIVSNLKVVFILLIVP